MKLLLSGTIFSAVISSLTPLAANAVTVPFTSILNGAQERPTPVNTPGIGTATGTLTGEPGSWVFNYLVNYSGLLGNIAAPFAHIHNAPQGVNGPIIHDLDNATLPPIAGSTAGTIIGDWRYDDATQPLTDAFAQQLQDGNLYFNLHTTFSRPGELRGQIQSVPEPSQDFSTFLAVTALAAGLKLKNRKQQQTIAN